MWPWHNHPNVLRLRSSSCGRKVMTHLPCSQGCCRVDSWDKDEAFRNCKVAKKCTTNSSISLVISCIKWNFILVLKLCQAQGFTVKNNWEFIPSVLLMVIERWSVQCCYFLALWSWIGCLVSLNSTHLLQSVYNTYLMELLWGLRELRNFSVLWLWGIYILKNAQKKKKQL